MDTNILRVISTVGVVLLLFAARVPDSRAQSVRRGAHEQNMQKLEEADIFSFDWGALQSSPAAICAVGLLLLEYPSRSLIVGPLLNSTRAGTVRNRMIVSIGLLLTTAQAAAQEPAAIRGNWIADVDGVRHIYMLIVRDGAVTGTYCVDCNNPLNLAFVMDGTLDDSGVRFTVFHDPETGAPYRDDVTGRLVDGDLHIERRRDGSSAPAVSMVLTRPAPPEPGDIPTPPVRPPYNPPGPPEPVTIEKAVGLWIAGTGPGKQYFMIRRVDDQLLGMVCGPCFEPFNMAPLDSFVIDEDQLHFDIVHEDIAGFNRPEPWVNAVRAVMSRNEMHLFVVPSFVDPDTFTPINMTLVGPVTYHNSTN